MLPLLITLPSDLDKKW